MTDAGPHPEHRVTVVVATRNRRESLLRTLEHHEAPTIVVDNGSADGTGEAVLRAFPQVRVLRLDRNLGAAARNLGAHWAGTPYVAFADDDSWWEPGALARAVQVLDEHPRIGLLSGRVLVGTGRREDPVSRQMRHSPLGSWPGTGLPQVLGFLACAAIVRRDAFLAAGGFDPVVHFLGEEERVALDLASAGWGLVYADDVLVRHLPDQRPGADPGARAALLTRNALLTGVMRLSWPAVARQGAEAVRRGGRQRAGLVHALPRLPRALARRRPIGPELEARLALLGRG